MHVASDSLIFFAREVIVNPEAGAALLSWTFTTLAVAAKHPMTSVSGFVAIETGFTVVQFVLVAPLLTFATRLAGHRTQTAGTRTA